MLFWAHTGVNFLDVKCFLSSNFWWALMRENLSSGFENNKSSDQPAYTRSLISIFVIHLLESIMSKLVTSQLSNF